MAGLKFKELPLKGAYIINLDKMEDERGFFARYWCKNEFEECGLDTNLVQINNSMNRSKGTLRGLHYQCQPKSETKIVRCIHGSIWDVIVDIRAGSPSFGKWYGEELNDKNRTMMYVPHGFAHGFQTLTDNVELLYLHSQFYSQEHEHGLLYSDKSVNIEWPLPVSVISERDKSHSMLSELKPFVT